MKVLQLLVLKSGERSPFEGMYVRDVDIESMALLVTADPAEARRFVDAAEALDYWQQQSVTRPFRPDGKPNRPLTAYSVAILPAPGSES